MQQTHPPQLKDVFRSAPTDSNHVKFPHFGAELSIGRDYSTNFNEFANPKAGRGAFQEPRRPQYGGS